MPEFWERQPGESAKAYYAFTLYRDLGHKRSITKVARLYNPNRQLRALMGRWSSKYLWVQRAAAYDDYLDALSRKEQEKEVRKMSQRHITLAMALQTKAAAKLQGLDGKTMRVRDAISAISTGTRLERLARGEPTEQLEAQVKAVSEMTLDWEGLTDDDRKQLIRAARIIIENRRQERS